MSEKEAERALGLTSHVITYQAVKLYLIETENDTLKRRVSELSKELEELKGHVRDISFELTGITGTHPGNLVSSIQSLKKKAAHPFEDEHFPSLDSK